MKYANGSEEPMRKITAQGLRAFGVTMMRALGFSDEEIAVRIGHTSGGTTIKRVYGGVPETWVLGGKPSFKPKGKPAWSVLFERRKASSHSV